MMIKSRASFSGFLLLVLLLLAPRRSLSNMTFQYRCCSKWIANLPSGVDAHGAQVEDVNLRAPRAEEGGYTSRSQKISVGSHGVGGRVEEE